MGKVAVIADIIESKSIPDRKLFQRSMEKALEEVNALSSDIISPYTVTLGDEFQALYRTGSQVIRDVSYLLTVLYPVRIRFSVSVGEISTDIKTDTALGMDGPVFHAARNGITRLKEYDHSIIQLYCAGENRRLGIINSSLRLSLALMAGWKQNTWTIFQGLLNGRTVQEILPFLKIKQRAVYKAVSTNMVRETVLICFLRLKGKSPR